MSLLSLLFEPTVTRYTVEDTWEVKVQSQCQADVLFDLCTIAVLLCHINERDECDLNPHHFDNPYNITFVSLLYGEAAPWLVPDVT